MHRGMPHTRAARSVALLVMTIAAGAGMAPARADTGPVAGARPLAVSVPADAATLEPGATGSIPIRIVNPGSKPVRVRVSAHGVQFGDNGRVTVAGTDPQWRDRVTVPTGPLTVAGDSYRTVLITARLPEHIRPDLYFVGFLVTPLPDRARSLTYINQIGSYVTIAVPGPRVRALAADLALPGFVFGNDVRGKLEVHNVGKAAAEYWGEVDASATLGSSAPGQDRIDRSLLPAARSRAITVTAKPSFLFTIVTMHARIVYPGTTEATTKEIDLTKRVVVIRPAALAVFGGLVLAAGILFVRRRRKRRQPKRPPGRAAAAARVDRRLAEVRSNREERELTPR
jgi:hypothetical protein